MKQRYILKKAVLLGMIGLTVYSGYSGSVKASVNSANPQNINTAETTTEPTITLASSEKAMNLYPIRVQTGEGIRYGYIDNTGKVIIKPIYMDADNFSEGCAVVSYENKNQVINQKGEVLFETEGFVQSFHQGMAAFSDPKANYKTGYINTQGKIVIKAKYNFAGNFRADHTAFVSKFGEFYVIDKNGKVLKRYQLNKKYNIYNLTDDGYIIYSDPKTYLQGVVNLEGKEILKPAYGEVLYLGSGLFGVKKALSNLEGYLIGIKPLAIYNKRGKRLTNYQFYDLSSFQGDYASATDDKYTYLLDKSGNKVSSLPELEGRGTMEVLGDVIKADIDNEIMYLKKDGTLIWKKDSTSYLASGITVSSVKIRPNKYVVVNYPEVSGISDRKLQSTINDKLKTIFTKSRLAIKESDYMTVSDSFTVKLIKNLLIINKTGYDYPIGAAHGMPINLYYFINVKNGDFYQLGDLFKSGSDYTSELSKIINQQMKRKSQNGDMVYFTEGNVKVRKDQFFHISKDSLTIYYDSGEIAAYAAGFPEFVIPWKDITGMINTDGAFWKSFHGKK